MQIKIKHHIKAYQLKFKLDKKSVILDVVMSILVFLFFAQLLFPSDRMLPFTRINGLDYSLWSKADVLRDLDNQYNKSTLSIYFGSAKSVFKTPAIANVGISADTKAAINKSNYVWYARLMPFSVAWYHLLINNNQISYTTNSVKLDNYISGELGDSCSVPYKNANLTLEGGSIKVVDGQNGGTCRLSDVRDVFKDTIPEFGRSKTIRIAMIETPPVITNQIASAFKDDLTKKIGDSVEIDVDGSLKKIMAAEIISWLDFKADDDILSYSINEGRASSYLNSNYSDSVRIKPGITKVTTYNFVETSRVVGSSGRVLDAIKTVESIKRRIDGASEVVIAATKSVAPSVSYERSYSPTNDGLSSLIKNYAESHNGVFGVSMIEIGGQSRFATYNENKVFVTASTYKLFVAYSSLKRVEDGSWHWNDQIADGRDLTKCLDDMIVKSDNNCGEALLRKIGFANITNEAAAIGCTSTSFIKSPNIVTTAMDLMTLLAKLQTGQILNEQSNRDILLNAMSRNIYRAGVPAGLPGISVSNKVGFMDGLLHDAAIINSPSGTYILIVMTEGSSWSTIADLTKQIEALRVQ